MVLPSRGRGWSNMGSGIRTSTRLPFSPSALTRTKARAHTVASHAHSAWTRHFNAHAEATHVGVVPPSPSGAIAFLSYAIQSSWSIAWVILQAGLIWRTTTLLALNTPVNTVFLSCKFPTLRVSNLSELFQWLKLSVGNPICFLERCFWFWFCRSDFDIGRSLLFSSPSCPGPLVPKFVV
jgi:hypothetical protein